MRRGGQGSILGNERNVLQALRTAPDLLRLVQFDMFALEIQFVRSPPWRHAEPGALWTDEDDTQLAAWLQGQGITVRGRCIVADCVAVVAHEKPIRPVREYFSTLTWDGIDRIDSWLEAYLQARGNPDYLSAIGRCWLLSAVAPIMQPGCKVDHLLVLESPQGQFKSMLAEMLAVRPEWFADFIGDVRHKDAAIQLAGKWILEISELAALRGPAVEATKAFISRFQDVYRPPYGRRAVTIPRQCVFLGTTNDKAYLRDRTGNRRYWPVRCGVIDIAALKRDREQLWAEALARFQAGEEWWLTHDVEQVAAEEQNKRLPQSEIDVRVMGFLDHIADAGCEEVTTHQVYTEALKLDPDCDDYLENTRRLGYQLSAALKHAGWHRVGARGRGRTRRVFYRLSK